MEQIMKQRASIDLLAAVSVACMIAFVAILCFIAAAEPDTRDLLAFVIVGLGAGGLILFRQLRKAASSLMASEARAHYAATHDPLTQLPNKTLLIERLRTDHGGVEGPGELDRPSVLCIGLDRFDEISEVLGPEASDDLIVEVAARLAASGQGDSALARVADDVFAVVWTGRDRAEIRADGEALLSRLGQPYQAAGGHVVVTCSIGLSAAAQAHANPAEPMRQAQMALSSARKRGGGRLGEFDASMDHALRSRNALEVELRHALAGGQMAMVYQPQVNAKGALVGVEALMRWTSDCRGAVPPSVFVPLAESCGLSESLDCFALRQAISDSRNWPGLKVAINISAAHIRSGGLVDAVKTVLAETGANPQDLELEITEGVLLADEAETYETLNAVRKLGLALSLDDFGTGYSSLSYLRRFPVDKIKIDRSFVSHLGKRPESSAIVQAIVDMADALGLKVIAEGVETADQVDRLTKAGCGHFQGFYYSKPVDAPMIAELIAGRASLAA
jgi:diguanylate cyclase (GGDEF)-like protein